MTSTYDLARDGYRKFDVVRDIADGRPLRAGTRRSTRDSVQKKSQICRHRERDSVQNEKSDMSASRGQCQNEKSDMSASKAGQCQKSDVSASRAGQCQNEKSDMSASRAGQCPK
ncbi:hypothetical protein EVAR_82275_1 [Eumeta japonica]|uniref:Uncharacterized protein n=1 Tax=Eumeta variegata TaxID=151549 RepID=A0A4C1VYG9_EUMVA|nr:hypothetical protein EVAR_82275_1 [Eumeta japonica]